MEKAFLSEQKARLEREAEAIRKNLSGFADPDTGHHSSGAFASRFQDMGRAEDENAGEVEMYQNNLSLEADLEHSLGEVESALLRISHTTYGTCQKCGEEIPVDRLTAYPAAITCVKCKTTL
ncbi:MAG: TraR/DksA C4-type zinc finger protein [Patescibacteria group bacterium]